jgi:hypothetical protein
MTEKHGNIIQEEKQVAINKVASQDFSRKSLGNAPPLFLPESIPLFLARTGR